MSRSAINAWFSSVIFQFQAYVVEIIELLARERHEELGAARPAIGDVAAVWLSDDMYPRQGQPEVYLPPSECHLGHAATSCNAIP